MKKLKPVTYVNGYYKSTTQNTMQQVLLLKAMAVTNDPKKLRDMIGARSVADVYRTFDKLSIRKEYHRALSKLGINFDYIASGIKNVCDTAEKDDVRLKGYQILLKSLGLDSYREDEGGDTSGWEEVLMKTIEKNRDIGVLESAKIDVDYEVKTPEIPDSVRKQKELELEEDVSKSIYE